LTESLGDEWAAFLGHFQNRRRSFRRVIDTMSRGSPRYQRSSRIPGMNASGDSRVDVKCVQRERSGWTPLIRDKLEANRQPSRSPSGTFKAGWMNAERMECVSGDLRQITDERPLIGPPAASATDH